MRWIEELTEEDRNNTYMTGTIATEIIQCPEIFLEKS